MLLKRPKIQRRRGFTTKAGRELRGLERRFRQKCRERRPASVRSAKEAGSDATHPGWLPAACPVSRCRSSECPSLVGRSGQGLAPRAEQQDAQEAVTKHVSGLADQVVPGLEAGVIHSKEKVKNRVENLAGVVGRQVRAGFDGDDDQPQDRGDPRLQNFSLAARQECRNPRRWLLSARYSIA